MEFKYMIEKIPMTLKKKKKMGDEWTNNYPKVNKY